jgi:hypothetical protein
MNNCKYSSKSYIKTIKYIILLNSSYDCVSGEKLSNNIDNFVGYEDVRTCICIELIYVIKCIYISDIE